MLICDIIMILNSVIKEFDFMNYVNESIKCDFKVPIGLQELIDLAEQADRDKDFGSYINYADAIDTVAKNCCFDGTITKHMWDLLVYRYVV